MVPLAAVAMESVDRRAGGLVEAPAGDEAGARGELGVLGGLDLGPGAGDVPDPGLVEHAREATGGRPMPPDWIIAPSATPWVESERGWRPGVALASRLPSR